MLGYRRPAIGCAAGTGDGVHVVLQEDTTGSTAVVWFTKGLANVLEGYVDIESEPTNLASFS